MEKGRIINLNGGKYKVLLEDGSLKTVIARGKLRHEKVYQANTKSKSNKKVPQIIKNSPKVGDICYIENDMIDHIDERINSLSRPDIANVTQIMVVFAAKRPDFSFYLLDLFLANIKKANIKPLIVITKIDLLLSEELEELKSKLSYYQNNLNLDVLYVNSKNGFGIDLVKEKLNGNITVLSGQTGAGKSTLINAIIPDFNLNTQEISFALGRGKHTTREVSLYQYNDGFIGDTPGFSSLEVTSNQEELMNYFPEFLNVNCKFRDCKHTLNSLGCMVRENVENGTILKTRYESYIKMLEGKKE